MIARLHWCPRTAHAHAERALHDARASLDEARGRLHLSRDIKDRTLRALEENHLREAAEFSLDIKRGNNHG